ncbi:MAG TPA: AsmA family protein [Rhizomicrobium sp.]|nr:AsmA family protein [Rhizomicrobium sp.]
MSLAPHTETSRWHHIWHDLVVGDFRDFQFTGVGFLRWSITVVVAFLVAILVTLYFLDWNTVRGPISNYLSRSSGREIRIMGDLKVDLFRRQPHIAVNDLTIGNPSWLASSRPQGARLDHAEMEFRLWPALFGHLVLPLVELDHPDFLLVRLGDGRTNWDRNGNGWKIPPIQNFLLKDGHVEIDDAVRHLKFQGSVSSRETAGGQKGSDKGAAFHLDGDGTLNAEKFAATVRGGPLLHVDESKPYLFRADIEAGPTHAIIDGQVVHPFHLDQWGGRVEATGKSLSELYDLTGIPLPATPPYHLTGTLKRDGKVYSVADLSGGVGRSDLQGSVSVDASGHVPALNGRVSSRLLDLDDLGPLFRGGKTPAETGNMLLPDVTLHTGKLRQVNGEVDYDADAIVSRDFPLRGLSTHISIENGVMILKPLAFAFTQGKLSGAVTIDARKDVPRTNMDARITDIHIEHFIKSGEKPLSGTVEARAQLSGVGGSVHKVASSANGTITAVVPQGTMKKSLAEWLGVNVISALGLTLSGDQSQTDLRCAVMSFRANNGVLNSQQILFDTDPTRLDGHGTVDLKNETLDLSLQGKPKHFELVRLRAPIKVSGSLSSPQISVDKTPALAQGALGAGLGVLSPFAAILAFVDPGLAKNADCSSILADAKNQGAPVKSSAVRNAPSK